MKKQVNIVFRAGLGVEARLLKQKRKGLWTHVGLLIGKDLFESVPDTEDKKGGVVKSSLDLFCAKEKALFTAFLPIYIDSAQAARLRNWCDLCHKRQSPFDSTYDLANDTAFYCSEFVYKAFRHTGIILCTEPFTRVHIPLSGTKSIIFPIDLAGTRKILMGLPASTRL